VGLGLAGMGFWGAFRRRGCFRGFNGCLIRRIPASLFLFGKDLAVVPPDSTLKGMAM
jgi:hypothetical protein